MLHKRASITTVLFLAAVIPLLALFIWLSGYQPPAGHSTAPQQAGRTNRSGSSRSTAPGTSHHSLIRLIRLKRPVTVSSNGKNLFRIPAGTLLSVIRPAGRNFLELSTNRRLRIPADSAAQQPVSQTKTAPAYRTPAGLLQNLQSTAATGGSLHSYTTDPLLLIPRSGPGPVALTRLDLQMLKRRTPFRKKFAGPPWNLAHLYARIRLLPFNTTPATDRSTDTVLWPSTERYGIQLELTRTYRKQSWLIRKIIWRELLPSDLR